MECKFYFNGKVFSSELELDDYLILHNVLEKSLGDEVYSLSDRSEVLKQYYDDLKKNSKKYKELRDSGTISEDLYEGGEDSDLDAIKVKDSTYRSVTDLIHGYKFIGEDGEEHPLFPIFNDENYWREKFKDYRNGKFDPYELQFLTDIVTLDSSGNPESIKSNEDLKKIRERMTSIWDQLRRTGNAIHDISNIFFSQIDPANKNYKRVYRLSDAEIEQHIKRKLKNNKDFTEFITDDILRSQIKLCRKLHQEIKSAYGESALIMTEVGLVTEANFDENTRGLVAGKLDLLVIGDSQHNEKIGIIDFKCSPKDFTENNPTDNPDPFKYNQAKIRTFKYQLATYRKMVLRILPACKYEPDLYIVPWKFEGFKVGPDGKTSFLEISSLNESLHKLDNSSYAEGGQSYSNIESHLLRMFPPSLKTEVISNGNILGNVKQRMDYMFPTEGGAKRNSDEVLLENIKKYTKEKTKGVWVYKAPRSKKEIEVKGTEAEAKSKILKTLLERRKTSEDFIRTTTQSLRKEIVEIQDSNREEESMNLTLQFKSYKSSYNNEDPLYLLKKFKKYLDPYNYEVILDEKIDPIMEELGILMFRNKHTGLIDVIKISREFDLKEPTSFNKRENLMGTFISDEEASKEKLIMKGTKGNVELIEAMAFVNELYGSSLFNEETAIGSIEVINPKTQEGISATNEQLSYNYDRLNKLIEKKNNIKSENNFYTSNKLGIKMATFVDVVQRDFIEIQSNSYENPTGFKRIYKSIKESTESLLNKMENGLNPLELKDELIVLKNTMEDNYPNLNTEKQEIRDVVDNPEYRLYLDIVFAIAELSGVKLYQQLEDHAKFNFSFTKGVSGTLIDNPGTMESPILNAFTEKVTEAYQRTRDNVINFNLELRKRVEALKKAKGFGLGKQYTVGNLVSDLYINMYDTDKKYDDGNSMMMFKNPWDPTSRLDDAERDFLKFALMKFNEDRGTWKPSEGDLGELIKNDPDKYLAAPLVSGNLASKVAAKGGWLSYIKYRFKLLSPKHMIELAKEEMGSLFVDKKVKDKIENGQQWEAINRLKESYKPETRKRYLTNEELGGSAHFEYNVETLLLLNKNAYVMEKELNGIFPSLRALTMHLNNLASIMNEKFSNDIQYIVNYIKSKIHGISLDNTENEAELKFKKITKEAMLVASKLALAFNPKQAYQFIDGIIKDVMIYIKYKGDDSMGFSSKHLWEAWKYAFRDMFHYGNSFTLNELINQLYGINDMDVNAYIDRIKTDNTGMLYNFWNVGFRFASRPDYYNRMTIFGAKMRSDGCWEAHSMVDGKLVYDCKKDKRFDAFVNDPTNSKNDPRYKQCKANYITTIRLMIEEGVVDKDGNPLKLDLQNPVMLPKAYSNKESESMKAFADRIYGYYAHEKKSMISSYYLGSLFMQMATYWSAKKNQYLQKRTYTLEGYYEDYIEDGVPYFWKEDENGNLTITDEDTGLPVQIWKGRPQEGIIVTLCNIINAMYGKDVEVKGIQNFKLIWNEPDRDLLRLYRANTRQLIYDLSMIFGVGKLIAGPLSRFANEFSKPSNIDSFGEAAAATGVSLFSDMLDTALDDANAWKSIIYDKGFRWTPFSIQTIDRLFGNFKRLITGDMDFYDFLIKFSAAGRLTEPVWNYVKQQVFDVKIGQSLYGLNRE